MARPGRRSGDFVLSLSAGGFPRIRPMHLRRRQKDFVSLLVADQTSAGSVTEPGFSRQFATRQRVPPFLFSQPSCFLRQAKTALQGHWLHPADDGVLC